MIQLVIRKDCLQTQFFVEPLSSEIGLDMISVPAGSFDMGSPENERKRNANEEPQHTVTIAPFFLGRYPITVFQWNTVAALKKQNIAIKPRSTSKGNHPVTTVSWLEAVEFCERLAANTGRPYRLPTEAEWEYACRAGTTTPFHFGETISPELANYAARTSYNDGPTGESPGGTTPVGHYGVTNAFGLSDMHGNVWEWCQDNWHTGYEAAPEDGSAWGNEDDGIHVMRGGSWYFFPEVCRSASRTQDNLSNVVGFRVALNVPKM